MEEILNAILSAISSFPQIRINSVNAGLLKTSASTGIPGYLYYYLFAEQLTLRKRAPATKEVANTVAFLLSERSSGINAQGIIVDAGMSINYFDKDIIKKAIRF
jgi:enoyl-[acyl-carrier protein] reductase I